MEKKFKIKKLTPWTRFNEYEGQIEGVVDGYSLCCYTLMSCEQGWSQYKSGEILDVNIYLERYGNVSILDDSITLPKVHQIAIAGVNYEVTGTVVQISGEMVLLDSVFPIEVDLDVSPNMRSNIPKLSVGNKISVEGVLKVELTPPFFLSSEF